MLLSDRRSHRCWDVRSQTVGFPDGLPANCSNRVACDLLGSFSVYDLQQYHVFADFSHVFQWKFHDPWLEHFSSDRSKMGPVFDTAHVRFRKLLTCVVILRCLPVYFRFWHPLLKKKTQKHGLCRICFTQQFLELTFNKRCKWSPLTNNMLNCR